MDEVVNRGVAERGRIAIGGHSYGAFMVANLLARSDLFSAGIARSGFQQRNDLPYFGHITALETERPYKRLALEVAVDVVDGYWYVLTSFGSTRSGQWCCYKGACCQAAGFYE